MDHVAAYATSKAGVVGLSRQMAIDFAEDGIRVNSVIVGGVDTAMSNLHLDFLGRDRTQGRYVQGVRRLGRVAAADEIAGALLFLASSDSAFVTGSALVVDGGQLARSSVKLVPFIVGNLGAQMPNTVGGQVAGKRYKTEVPDTLDLVDRANLAINGLARARDPDADGNNTFISAC